MSDLPSVAKMPAPKIAIPAMSRRMYFLATEVVTLSKIALWWKLLNSNCKILSTPKPPTLGKLPP